MDSEGTLYVGQDYEDSWEEWEDEHLYCVGCLQEWLLPREVSFADLDDDQRG